jgi:hypothetical protein
MSHIRRRRRDGQFAPRGVDFEIRVTLFVA